MALYGELLDLIESSIELTKDHCSVLGRIKDIAKHLNINTECRLLSDILKDIMAHYECDTDSMLYSDMLKMIADNCVGGYTPLTYIQSTGTQYIDTEYEPCEQTKVELKFFIEEKYAYLIGARQTGMFNDWSFSRDANTFCFYYGNTWQGDIYASFDLNNDIVAELECGKMILNGNEFTSGDPYGEFRVPYSMYIFSANKLNETYTMASMKLYYMKIWEDGTLVKDFIPVLDEDGVACLYDKISEKYFYNAGSGEFIASEPI